jgi:hypothetical protein
VIEKECGPTAMSGDKDVSSLETSTMQIKRRIVVVTLLLFI